MKRPIKVGILVSYDYECIYNSLPLVYERADKIVLAADKDGKTWSGNKIEIPDTFWQWVKELDVQHKIEIYKDTFYVEGLTPMQCETRERNMLAQYMGEGGWHVQVDADEYFADFGHFVDFLSYLDKKRKRVNLVKMQWLILYKKTANGYLFIKNSDIPPSVATTTPQYVVARNVACIKSTAYYNQRVVHESLARTEDALWTKLTNWGHTTDFDIEAYFEYWKGINEKNYKYVVDFHPFSISLREKGIDPI